MATPLAPPETSLFATFDAIGLVTGLAEATIESVATVGEHVAGAVTHVAEHAGDAFDHVVDVVGSIDLDP